MEKTPVQFLVDHLLEYGFSLSLHSFEIQQALDMEKDQRMKDFKAGCIECGFEHSAGDWAKEHFKNK